MKRLTFASGLLVLVLSGGPGPAAVAQEASVYKWVDAQGVPHFSDQPAADASAEETSIRFRKTDRGTMQARLKAKSELAAAGETREGLESDADAAAEADRQKVVAERESICRASKDLVAKYSTAQRLYRPGKNGERVYLTDEEIDAERANANRAVEQSCGDE